MEKVERRDGLVFDIAVRVTCRTEDGREHTGKIVFRHYGAYPAGNIAHDIIGAGWPSQLWDGENEQLESLGLRQRIIPSSLVVLEVLGSMPVEPGAYRPLVVDDFSRSNGRKV